MTTKNAQWGVSKIKTHAIYRVACPICGHKYVLALFEKYDYEFCPLCGYGNSLALFIDEGEKQ
jgi:rRNA maturation endonuclease Nob1